MQNEGGESGMGKKRRKKYQDLEEYLNIDGSKQANSFQGLLMRDQKYLRKNFHKYATFHVKDFANKVKKSATNPL